MNLCMSIGSYDMARWGFDMIHREEYERVCNENRELKKQIEQLENLLGGTRDTERTKTISSEHSQD